MEKFIPYEKLSKKEKRKADAAKRSTWGQFNPATRKPPNSKAYNRNKARNWKRKHCDTSSGNYFIGFMMRMPGSAEYQPGITRYTSSSPLKSACRLIS